MTFSGWVATVSGWYVTEIGRQPWLVNGVLASADAASALPPTAVASSLAMYLALYAVLPVAHVGAVFHLAGKAGAGAPAAGPAAAGRSPLAA